MSDIRVTEKPFDCTQPSAFAVPADRPTNRHASTIDTTHVFRACCILVSIHILTDELVFVRPGTSPAEHLFSSAVPVLMLAGVAWSFQHVRAGSGAALSGVLGLAVVIGGIGAPAGALIGGQVSFNTLIGSAATLAGPVMIALSATVLYRSRRRGPGRLRTWTRRIARAGLGLLLAIMVAAPIGMSYLATNLNDPPTGEFDLGRPHENLTLHTADGLGLAASYVPSTNGAAIILFPGRSSDQTTIRARMLTKHGFGVLVVDPRGRGDSDGDPNLFGWSGEEDLRAAIRYVRSRPDVDRERIGGLGLSVGGELMLQTAAHDTGLRAVVAEGAGSRSINEDIHMPAPDISLGLPFSAVTTAATAVFSNSLPPGSLHDIVDDISPRPMMLIWTPKGNGEKYFNPKYYDRAGEPKITWEIPESTHINGLHTRPDEYERRVITFFNDALT